MLQLIKKTLLRPHPGYDNFSAYAVPSLGIAFIVFLILSILQPFDIGARNILGNPFLTASVYAAGSIITALINYTWIKFFPDFFKNENWNIGKEIFSLFYQLITISTAIWLINVVREISSPTVSGYYSMLLNVTSVAIFPYLTVLIVRNIYLFKKRSRKAAMMNINLFLNNKKSPDVSFSDMIDIDKFVEPVDMNKFLSAEEKDGYLVVKVARNEDVDELIVGSTLSEFEGGNSHFNQLFKCNNSIIVNINRVLWVEGNAAGYKLALHPKLPPVAVADDKRIKFKKLMEVI